MKRRKKTIIPLIMILLAVLLFTGCPSPADDPGNTTDATENTTDDPGNTTDATGNTAPTVPVATNPNPNTSNVEIENGTTTTFTWTTSTDADGDSITYDIYFSTSSSSWPDDPINQTETTYDYNASSLGTVYWKVVAKDGNGGETASSEYSFSVVEITNALPTAPVATNPDPDTSGVEFENGTTTTLSWTASTDTDGDSITYDIYFSTSSSSWPDDPINQTETTYDYTASSTGTKYWKIVAKDGNGGETDSDKYSFTIVEPAIYSSVTSWGTYGTGDNQFNTPRGITVDSGGNVYVADTNNDRVVKYSNAGSQLLVIGVSGSGDGQLDSPLDVAIDSNGNIYITDALNCRVQKFNSAGVFQSSFGGNGTSDGLFKKPSSIFIDSSDNIYVTDTYVNYNSSKLDIQKFDSNGNFVLKIGSISSASEDGTFYSGSGAVGPKGIFVDSTGNIFVTGTTKIQKFSSTGSFIFKIGYPTTQSSDSGYFDKPSGITVDSSGNIYVADDNNKRIQKFDSEGTYIGKFGTYGSDEGDFKSLNDLAIDSNGNLFVVEGYKTYSARVQKFVLR